MSKHTDPRSIRVPVRLTDREHAIIAAAAQRHGLGLSSYMRVAAMREAMASRRSARALANQQENEDD